MFIQLFICSDYVSVVKLSYPDIYWSTVVNLFGLLLYNSWIYWAFNPFVSNK